MPDNLIKNIQDLVEMSEEELNYFLPMLQYRFVKKNDLFLRTGDSANYVGYMNSGLLRYYCFVGDKEYTVRVSFPNEWVGDYTSFLLKRPATLNIEALENTVILQFSYEHLQKAYDRFKNFERLGRLIGESLFVDMDSKVTSFFSQTPEERYVELITKHPEIIAKIPLKYISSMLGIQPESLSRIRKRMQDGK